MAIRKFSFIPIIIIVNAIVYFMWASAKAGDTAFMAQNFLVSWDALVEGRYWTLLTSVFSHNMLFHFLINMFVLNSFGRVLEDTIGPKRFIIFYLVAGILSSFVHCAVSQYYLHQPSTAALGASGAVAGVVLLFSLLYPREKIYLLGFIPLPAIWGALAFIGLDIWGLIEQGHGGGLPIGHGAHLGGAFTGIFYFFFFIRVRLKGKASYNRDN